MTFEEFKALALNPPPYDGQSVFRVDTYCYYEEWIDMGEPYSLHLEHSSLHHSLADAESSLTEIKSKIIEKGMKVYCHFIYEIPVGFDTRMDKYASIRVYDECGNLTEQSVCSQGSINNPVIETFRGRGNSMIKHNVGDYVEILGIYGEDSSADVRAALITDVPKSIETSWAVANKLPNGVYMEWVDDHYRYIDSPRHEMWIDEVHPIFAFKPRFHISDERKQELIGYSHNNSVLQSSYWRENGSEKDLIVCRVAAIDKRYRPYGPPLTPEDFLPFYAAKEYFNASVSVKCSVSNPLDMLTDKLLELRPDIFKHFTGFIINFIDTDIKNKRLRMSGQYKWWNKLKQNYPNLSKINKVKRGFRLCPGASEYRLEIIAYN